MQSISEAAIEGAGLVDAGLYGPPTQGAPRIRASGSRFLPQRRHVCVLGGGPQRAGAIPSILNVVMPTQVALPLSQPVTRPAARLLPSRLRVLPSPTPPYGDNADSVTPLVLRRPSSNLQIRRLRQVVQDRPLRSVRWADIPQLSVSDRRCLAAWQQHWQQSRLYDFDSRPSGSSKLVDHP